SMRSAIKARMACWVAESSMWVVLLLTPQAVNNTCRSGASAVIWSFAVAARAPLLQDGPEAFEGRRHRLPADRVAVALEVERARGRVAAAPLPADPDRAHRLVLGAAARSGDAGDRDRNARARVDQRPGHHLEHGLAADRAVLLERLRAHAKQGLLGL